MCDPDQYKVSVGDSECQPCDGGDYTNADQTTCTRTGSGPSGGGYDLPFYLIVIYILVAVICVIGTCCFLISFCVCPNKDDDEPALATMPFDEDTIKSALGNSSQPAVSTTSSNAKQIKNAKYICMPFVGILALIGAFALPYFKWSLGWEWHLTTVSIDSFECAAKIRDGGDACSDVFFSSCKSELPKTESPAECLGAFPNGMKAALFPDDTSPYGFSSYNLLTANNLLSWKTYTEKWFTSDTIAKPIILPGLTKELTSDLSDYFAAVPLLGANSILTTFFGGSVMTCPSTTSYFRNCTSTRGTWDWLYRGSGVSGFWGEPSLTAPASFPTSSGTCDECKFKTDEITVTMVVSLEVKYGFAGASFIASCTGDGCQTAQGTSIGELNTYFNTSSLLADWGLPSSGQFSGDKVGDYTVREMPCPQDENQKITDVINKVAALMIAWASIVFLCTMPCMLMDDSRRQTFTRRSTKCCNCCLLPFIIVNLVIVVFVYQGIETAVEPVYPIVLYPFKLAASSGASPVEDPNAGSSSSGSTGSGRDEFCYGPQGQSPSRSSGGGNAATTKMDAAAFCKEIKSDTGIPYMSEIKLAPLANLGPAFSVFLPFATLTVDLPAMLYWLMYIPGAVRLPPDTPKSEGCDPTLGCRHKGVVNLQTATSIVAYPTAWTPLAPLRPTANGKAARSIVGVKSKTVGVCEAGSSSGIAFTLSALILNILVSVFFIAYQGYAKGDTAPTVELHMNTAFTASPGTQQSSGVAE